MENSISKEISFGIKYRIDIEGLRALAIILVVASHLNIHWLKGGFVGVDVFFVLSGYLVTGLLINEIEITGKINIIKFINRRLKRLLPALYFMVIATSLFSIIAISPHEQYRQAVYSKYVLLWISNIKLIFSNFDYFKNLEINNVLIHCWTLGVEQQFYLIWPFIILLIYKLSKITDTKKEKVFYLFISLILAISLFFCVFLTYKLQKWAFYSMPTRLWQFSIGGLSGFLLKEKNSFIIKNNIIDKSFFIGISGIALIIFSAVSFRHNVPYPSFRSIVPSIGAALVIIAGSSTEKHLVSNLLSVKPMQWLGKISYSWYLWHWPVIALGRLLHPLNDLIINVKLIIISLFISVFSYYIVERPIRINNNFTKKPAVAFGSFAILILICFIISSLWSKNIYEFIKSPEQIKITNAKDDLPEIYSAGCDEWFNSSSVKICGSGSVDSKRTAMIVGDSVAAQWYPAIQSIFNSNEWKVLIITKSGCPFIDETIYYDRIGREYTECNVWRNKVTDKINFIKPDVVFLSNARYGFNKEQWIYGLVRILDKIKNNIDNILIINSTPLLQFDGPECLSRQKSQNILIPFSINCTTQYSGLSSDNINEWQSDASNQFDNVSTINMNDIICPDDICNAEINGIITYRDSQHLSATYAKSLSKNLAIRINKVINNKTN